MKENDYDISNIKPLTDILAKTHPNLNSAPDTPPEENAAKPIGMIKQMTNATTKYTYEDCTDCKNEISNKNE